MKHPIFGLKHRELHLKSTLFTRSLLMITALLTVSTWPGVAGERPGTTGHLGLTPDSSSFHASSPAGESVEVGGFSWAENLTFDAAGDLYVSDSEKGTITRIWWNGQVWATELFFTGMRPIGGLATDSSHLYATATSVEGVYEVIKIPLGDPGQPYEVIAELPFAGNGMERDVDGLLYVTTEGNFIPGQGAVYRVYPTGGHEIFLDGLWAANGISIDIEKRMAYVGQVTNNRVYVVDLTSGLYLRSFYASLPDGCLLDDFDLDPAGEFLYGADFGRGRILRIPAAGGVGTTVYSGLDAATSAMFAPESVYGPGSLMVTEGGGFVDTDTGQRVLEIDVAGQ